MIVEKQSELSVNVLVERLVVLVEKVFATLYHIRGIRFEGLHLRNAT